MATILEPGEIEAAASSPPFLHLPPNNLFALRAQRLERLAGGHPLADYLLLVAGLCGVQQQLMDDPPVAALSDPERLRVCQQHGLPPFAADSLVREDDWLPWLDALLRRYQPPAQLEVECDNPLAQGWRRTAQDLGNCLGQWSVCVAARGVGAISGRCIAGCLESLVAEHA